MPKCKNDPTRSYTGDEPSPKGYGYCAHAEKQFTVMPGTDGQHWYVGDGRWKKVTIPSVFFIDLKHIHKSVKLDTSLLWLKKYAPDLKTVDIIKITKGRQGNDINVHHTGSWAVYGNKPFVKAVETITKLPFVFSEQGMQKNGIAHMEVSPQHIVKVIKKLH